MTPENLGALKNILEQEEDVLVRLLNLEKDKNRILVSGEYSDLPVVTEKEDRLTDTLTALEEKRLTLAPDGQENISRVLASLPPEKGKEWSVRKSHLTGILRELRLYNDMNRRVLEESIAFFRYSLSLFTGEDSTSPVYTPDGERPHAHTGASLVLDRSI